MGVTNTTGKGYRDLDPLFYKSFQDFRDRGGRYLDPVIGFPVCGSSRESRWRLDWALLCVCELI